MSKKYTITHVARITTVQDGVIRTTCIGTLADMTHALELSPIFSLALLSRSRVRHCRSMEKTRRLCAVRPEMPQKIPGYTFVAFQPKASCFAENEPQLHLTDKIRLEIRYVNYGVQKAVARHDSGAYQPHSELTSHGFKKGLVC